MPSRYEKNLQVVEATKKSQKKKTTPKVAPKVTPKKTTPAKK